MELLWWTMCVKYRVSKHQTKSNLEYDGSGMIKAVQFLFVRFMGYRFTCCKSLTNFSKLLKGIICFFFFHRVCYSEIIDGKKFIESDKRRKRKYGEIENNWNGGKEKMLGPITRVENKREKKKWMRGRMDEWYVKGVAVTVQQQRNHRSHKRRWSKTQLR